MSRARSIGVLAGCVLMMMVSSVLLLHEVSSDKVAAQERQDVFRNVPENLRLGLINKLKQYILFRRTHQWGKLYDLYSREYVARRWPPPSVMTRDEFIEGNEQDEVAGRGSNLLRFKASKVRFRAATEDAPARAFIEGCAEYYASKGGKRVGRSKRLKSIVEAVHDGKEWFLSDIVVNYSCEGCEAEKCRMN